MDTAREAATNAKNAVWGNSNSQGNSNRGSTGESTGVYDQTRDTARDTVTTAKNAVWGNSNSQGNSSKGSTGESTVYGQTKDTANQAYDAAANPSDTASAAYDKGSEYVPNVGDGKTTTASILNSTLFRNFKPDPSMIWKGHLVYLLLTAGATIPFWTFIVGVDYFQSLYPGTHIIRLFVLAYYLPWLVVHLLVASFGRGVSAWIKINVGLSISIVVLVLMTLLNGIFTGEKGTSVTFWVTLAAVALSGCGDSIAQGCLSGIVSELPVSFAKAFCDGAAVSGVLVFIVRIIVKTSLSNSATGLRIGGIVYFSIAALFVALVIALFSYLHYMPEMGYYNSLGWGSFEVVRLLIENEDTVTLEVSSGAAIAAVASGRESPSLQLHWGDALNKTKMLAISIFVTACITYSIFPGPLAEDVKNWDYLGSYSQLLLVGTYIISDLVGRLITGSAMVEKESTIFGAAWARLLLFVLFILAVLFSGSFIILVLLAVILGVSNGYLISTITVLIPRSVNPALKETSGILNVLIVVLGALLGTGLSWIWVIAANPRVHLIRSTELYYGVM